MLQHPSRGLHAGGLCLIATVQKCKENEKNMIGLKRLYKSQKQFKTDILWSVLMWRLFS